MKKKLLTTVSMFMVAIALIIGSIAGTLAYLRATASVTNTFTYGTVAITMDETLISANGLDVAESNQRVVGNSYMLMPDTTYTKDPIIHVNANSSEMFLFLKVDNGIAGLALTAEEQQAMVDELKAADPDITEQEIQQRAKLRIHQQLLANGWKIYQDEEGKVYQNKLTSTFGTIELSATSTVYYLSVGAGEAATDAKIIDGTAGDIKTFSCFTTSRTSANEASVTAYVNNDAKIVVTAYAIQSTGDGIGENIHNAAAIFAPEFASAIPAADNP